MKSVFFCSTSSSSRCSCYQRSGGGFCFSCEMSIIHVCVPAFSFVSSTFSLYSSRVDSTRSLSLLLTHISIIRSHCFFFFAGRTLGSAAKRPRSAP